jgi:hypothetical protein
MKTPDQLVDEVEARVRPTICNTFGTHKGEFFETVEGRISITDFVTLLRLYRAASAASRLPSVAAKLADAIDSIRIQGNGRWNPETKEVDKSTWWYVVDTSQADHECGYPGDLISDHVTLEDARIGLAVALIEAAGKP